MKTDLIYKIKGENLSKKYFISKKYIYEKTLSVKGVLDIKISMEI